MGIYSLLRLEHVEIYNDTRRGKEKREKRKERQSYDMQDDPTSGALCLASLEPRQAGASAQIKGSCEG